MRILPLTGMLWLASALLAEGQVTVQILLDQDQFLRDESLPVKLRVTNLAGQTLHLGRDNAWLTFALEGMDGAVVSKLADPPVAGEFAVESAQAATREV